MSDIGLDVKKKDNRKLFVIISFLSLYIFWGPVYLGIRVAIETLPPFITAGIRFFSAGLILYMWMRLKGARRPEKVHWLEAGKIGALMMLGANGIITWAEQKVPSGIAALLIASTPLWILIFSWIGKEGKAPNIGVVIGIVSGMSGMIVLVLDSVKAENKSSNLLGILALLFAAVFWAIGSIYSRNNKLPYSLLLSTAMQMLTGGLLLFIASSFLGEWSKINIAHVSTKSFIALGYLIILAGIVGYSSYIWLLKNAGSLLASTYTFVNPVIAVILGNILAGEKLTVNILIASVLIIAAVVIVTIFCNRSISLKEQFRGLMTFIDQHNVK